MTKNRHSDDTADTLSADIIVPGPSPNPATNQLINDVILRTITRVSRETLERVMMADKAGKSAAKKALGKQSKAQTAIADAATRVASRSLPGLALVGTGLVAKTLFDRSQHKRKAKQKLTPRD